MDFNHLKERLKNIVGARRGRSGRLHDNPDDLDHDAAEELEREIEEASSLRRDADREHAEWDRMS
jgi:hypothetical protein